MKKIILIIVIALLAGIGGYFLLRSGYQAPAPVSAPTPAPGINSETVEEKVVSEGTSEIKEFTVSGTEYSFSPSSVTVKAGDQVIITFRNTGRLIHNLVIEGLGISSKTIRGGQTDTIEFTAPASGAYTIFCSVPGHRAAGMEATLKVE